MEKIEYEYSEDNLKKYIAYYNDIINGRIKWNLSSSYVLQLLNCYNVLTNVKDHTKEEINNALIFFEHVEKLNNVFNEGNVLEHNITEYKKSGRK